MRGYFGEGRWGAFGVESLLLRGRRRRENSSEVCLPVVPTLLQRMSPRRHRRSTALRAATVGQSSDAKPGL